MPSVLDNDQTADMSFSGIATYGKKLFYEPYDPLYGVSEMRAKKVRRQMSLAQLTNLAASLNFSVCHMLNRSFYRSQKMIEKLKQDRERFLALVGNQL